MLPSDTITFSDQSFLANTTDTIDSTSDPKTILGAELIGTASLKCGSTVIISPLSTYLEANYVCADSLTADNPTLGSTSQVLINYVLRDRTASADPTSNIAVTGQPIATNDSTAQNFSYYGVVILIAVAGILLFDLVRRAFHKRSTY